MDEINDSAVKKARGRWWLSYRVFGLSAILLLVSGCGPNVLDLSAKGQVEQLDTLLVADPELIHFTNDLGQSPIHYAASHNRLDSLIVLIKHGVDLNAQDGTGLSALHMAAGGDHHFLVRELLKEGAQADITDSFGDTALHHAAIHGAARAVAEMIAVDVELLSVNDEGKTALVLAQEFNRSDVVILLENINKIIDEGAE